MVRHVILWKLKEELSGEEKLKVMKEIKENLEGLVGRVPGLNSVSVIITPLGSSNADVMLDSVLESEEALKGYQTHPEHVTVADTYVRPYTEVRMCMDYEM
ncbi:MAG: Dabb family protein [Lachnospiraceae bacterium]|nr:Dabb family protein [Lachnospiraceae bacterium]